jgi:hypothetical protein
MVSKGQDVQAYTRLLKFQKKRYGVQILDFLILIVALVLMIVTTLLMVESSTGSGSSLIFIMGIIFTILLLITFFDYAFNLGLFHENSLSFSSVVILLAVLISTIISFFQNDIFTKSDNEEGLSFLSMINMLMNSFVIAYFVTTSTPTREGRDEMIQKLSEIRKEITDLPIADLGSVSSVDRALRWIQYQQRDDGIWGESNPLFETSEVLRMFVRMGKGLKYSWKTVIDGKEETHTVEQTYYLVLEALDTAIVEPTNEMLIPVLGIAEIDPSFVDLNNEVFEEFKEDLSRFSEWEFIKEIHRFDDTSSAQLDDIPIIFTMAKLFYQKQEYEIAQKCADIFANTFGILINRASTRFNISNEKEISNNILGIMYNALVDLLRKPKLQEAISEPGIAEPTGAPDVALTAGIPDLSDLDSFDEGLPLDSIPEEPESQIKIGTSLASIRNYIQEMQSIDGSWSGNIEYTAECLASVSDQESPESEHIKAAIHYILALQDKNGSWQNDIVLTAKVTKVLHQINQTINLGVF